MWTITRGRRQRVWRDLTELFGRRPLRRVEAMLAALAEGRAGPPDASPQRAQNLWMPDLPSRPWYEREEFPWVAAAESVAGEVAREAAALRARDGTFGPYLDAPEEQANPAPTVSGLRSPTEGWLAHFFCRDGRWRHDHLGRCPHTARLLAGVPLGVGDVMFSMLEAGTEIPPHHGLDNLSLTCHLALRVPDGCSLTVDGEARAWTEGRCTVFDDTFLHAAENRSATGRLVLLFDFWHPGLSAVEVSALRYLIPLLKSPHTAPRRA